MKVFAKHDPSLHLGPHEKRLFGRTRSCRAGNERSYVLPIDLGARHSIYGMSGNQTFHSGRVAPPCMDNLGTRPFIIWEPDYLYRDDLGARPSIQGDSGI